jgi:hypothetical protein
MKYREIISELYTSNPRDCFNEIPHALWITLTENINPKEVEATKLRLMGKTYKAIGEQLINGCRHGSGKRGVTVERARQIVAKGTRRLCRTETSRKAYLYELDNFLPNVPKTQQEIEYLQELNEIFTQNA